MRNGGMVTCYDPLTGKVILDRERLAFVGHYVSSPVAANGYIYTAAESGTVCVFKASEKLEVVARNALEELITATPAIVDDKIYVRGREHVFAFGKP